MQPQTQEEYLIYLEQLRWDGIPRCPYCESTKATAYKNEHRYRCNACFTSYSVTVGTLFHRSHVELRVWFKAIQLVLNSSDDLSVRQLSKELGINKNTAAYMLARIRQAMAKESAFLEKLSRQGFSTNEKNV